MSCTVLLIACYELGHQPLSLAWPLAFLREHGVEATAVDLTISEFPTEAAQEATFVGVAAPMHTALRLGVRVAQQVRYLNPNAHICFYGLYGWLNADYLLDAGRRIADSVLAGEVEQTLLVQIEAVLAGETAVSRQRQLKRLDLPMPLRHSLPPLHKYAHYVANGMARVAGYTETTRGCLHTCRHCPVVPVYNGRFFAISADVVLADIEQQVAAGAKHITFGDPDFLNGPGHAQRIATALHAAFPQITFDFTTKVEHILKHPRLLGELRQLGASFVVSAFESTSELVLKKLKKGHTRADMDRALAILAAADLPVQPTWVPFTPWTTLADYIDMLTWIRERGLIAHIPAIQLAIRLLVPPGSALLSQPGVTSWLGELDAANFTYRWQHPDPRLDELQGAVLALAERGHDHPFELFAAIERLAYNLANRPVLEWLPPPLPNVVPPRLTENWYC